MENQTDNDNELFNYEFEIRNLGSIETAIIKITPMTLFIGPNNSGKSYVAMAIYAIMRAFSRFQRPRPRSYQILGPSSRSKSKFPRLKTSASIDQRLNVLFNRLRKTQRNRKLPKPVINGVMRLIESNLAAAIEDEITRTFASSPSRLIRSGCDEMSFIVKSPRSSLTITFAKRASTSIVLESEDIDLSIQVDRDEDGDLVAEIVMDNSNIDSFGVYVPLYVHGSRERLERQVQQALVYEITRYLVSKDIMDCWYLPAARSGILQGYKALTSRVIEMSPYAGIEEFRIPRFPGVIADLISNLMWLTERKGKLASIADQFQKDVLHGTIRRKVTSDELPPDIQFRYRRKTIPLHGTSSAVSELVPLLLYLKYVVQPGSLLIIEEPEAHLHPSNQIKLANLISILVRRKVQIVVTTHSDFLLEAINKYIRCGFLPESKLEEMDESGVPYLVPAEVGAYLFSMPSDTLDTETTNLRITKDEGISEEEFARVRRELYDEAIKLDELLESK